MTDQTNTDDDPYPDHPTFGEQNKMRLEVNNREYLLNDEFLGRIEEVAERFYDGNSYVEYAWRIAGNDEEDHEPGDPILHIETEGPVVPWDRLSEMRVEMEDIDAPQAAGSADDVDNGNQAMGVDPSEVGEDEMDDFKIIMTPKGYRAYPDPDDGEFSTLPPEPEEYPDDDPELVVPIPENDREERWSTGRAITPAFTDVEWNLQKRADSAPTDATEFNGQERTDSHNQWEGLLRACDCEVVGKVQPTGKPTEGDTTESDRKSWDYDQNDGNNAGSNEVGDRWQL